MANIKAREVRGVTAGDAAVDGLISGGLAGGVMGALLVLLQLLNGVGPLTTLGYFDPAGQGSPGAGALTHLAVAGVYGLLFGLLTWRLRGASGLTWMAVGIVYGLLIFFVAQAIIMPRAGALLKDIPAWEFALAHATYGAALGWWDGGRMRDEGRQTRR